MSAGVNVEAAGLAKRFFADHTDEWFLLGVCPQVTFQAADLHKRLVALVTFERFDVRMEAQMIYQIRFSNESFAAHLALVLSFGVFRVIISG